MCQAKLKNSNGNVFITLLIRKKRLQKINISNGKCPLALLAYGV